MDPLPRAPEDATPPGYTTIQNWGKFLEQTGLNKYTDQLSKIAGQHGLSSEDAAYRTYYGLPYSGSYGIKAPVSGNFTGGAESQEIAKRQQMAAIKPAIQSLEASIPETQQKFATERARLEGEKEPLKQRYETLLADLKNKESQQVKAASINAAREFGRRGIPLSSTYYGDFLGETVNPIQQNYSTLTQQTAQGREDALRNITNLQTGLVPQETEALRSVRNAIAQMQAGAGKDALENAFRQLQFEETRRQFDQQQALAQEEASFRKQQADAAAKASDLQRSLAERQFNLIDLPMAQYTLNKPYYKSSGSGVSSGW